MSFQEAWGQVSFFKDTVLAPLWAYVLKLQSWGKGRKQTDTLTWKIESPWRKYSCSTYWVKYIVPIITPHLHTSSIEVFLTSQSLNPDELTVNFLAMLFIFVFIVDIQMNFYWGMLSQRSKYVHWTVSLFLGNNT